MWKAYLKHKDYAFHNFIGVIDMPTNQTHEEMIKSKFIEKFRNPLRNYYTYGFMNYPSIKGCEPNFATLPGTRKTLDEDWVRLSNILRQDQYFQWSTERSKVAFISADSQSQQCNPFHRVYRFSMYTDTDLVIFFNTVLALSDKYELAEAFYSVGECTFPAMKTITDKRNREIERDRRTDSKGITHSYISLFQSFLENYERREMTYKQIAAFCAPVSKGFLEEDQRVRKYLTPREKLHLLREVSPDGRNIKWKLNEITLRYIISECGDEAELFFDAIDFFSRFFVLGEYGTYLLSRAHKASESVFRFKHEYFAQSLNDYIIIDLLKAMEDKLWCKITQTNPISGEEQHLICFPLQIRTSQTNGRQYLSFYAPHNHSYSSIRLDLITALELIENIEMNGEDISLENLQIKEEISNALTGIYYSWGVSTTDRQEDNAKCPVPLKEVRLVIQYNPDGSEYYIVNRLNHEKRHGTITILKDKIVFSIKVTDPREMRPWIRSFYSRIVECYGIDTDTFHLADEVNEYQELDNHFTNFKPDTTFNANWYIPEGTTFTKVEESDSDSLFNPFFGVYFMLFGDVLSSLYQLGGNHSDCLSANAVKECIERSYKKREQETGLFTRRSFVSTQSKYNLISALNDNLFIKCGYMEHDTWVEGIPKDKKDYVYHMKYKAVQKTEPDLFFDVIPLTAWELRWVCTILHDEKMKLFLSPNTINKLLALMPDNIKPINVSNIIVFDRYHSIGHKPNAEVFRVIVSALHKCVSLQIKYTDGKGRKYEGTYFPLHIEYSKRDDRFRLYVVDDTSKHVHIMNIDGITSISNRDRAFSLEDYQKILSDFLKNTSKQITLEFIDTKNIPDRLLNEFAPWRKRCELINPKTKLYGFTLYYHKYDEIDVLIRLMSYGPYIRIVDKNHFIYKELMERIEKQNELFRDREKDR